MKTKGTNISAQRVSYNCRIHGGNKLSKRAEGGASLIITSPRPSVNMKPTPPSMTLDMAARQAAPLPPSGSVTAAFGLFPSSFLKRGF